MCRVQTCPELAEEDRRDLSRGSQQDQEHILRLGKFGLKTPGGQLWTCSTIVFYQDLPMCGRCKVFTHTLTPFQGLLFCKTETQFVDLSRENYNLMSKLKQSTNEKTLAAVVGMWIVLWSHFYIALISCLRYLSCWEGLPSCLQTAAGSSHLTQSLHQRRTPTL